MTKQTLTIEQKRLDTDLWIIILVTWGFFSIYAIIGNQLMNFVKDSEISVIPRLLVNAVVQFGVAGIGISLVCILRKERFSQFGLKTKNMGKTIIGTALCFAPIIGYILASGQFRGYKPFGTILITKDVLSAGVPVSIIGMAIIIVVWGFFEGFNYVVICDKVNKRYPSTNQWIDYGAITCAIVCILFHQISISFWGIVEMVTTFIAIYGMLIVRKKTGNAWGCIFAFLFIWNAI
ncbi:MAG: hypothetical protein Q4E53_14625 [Eubacteriales bacterium]|nr:hypothetical protein [Eubacteriales bacterium]